MKILRFIRNLLREAGYLALCLIVAFAFMGVVWCVGWVANSLGMPVPQGAAFSNTPILGCGMAILAVAVVLFALGAALIGIWRWLRNQWDRA